MTSRPSTKKCANCGKYFNVVVTPMGVAGGKMREDINCPYCLHENGTCMTDGIVHTSPIEPQPKEDE